MKKFCIVIPVYKDKLDCTEELSLKRLYKVIYKNSDNLIDWKEPDVYLICPKKMNTDEYKKIYPSIKVKEFDKKWFESTASYSQLCIQYSFYNKFSKYEYMYIYQLDCYLVYDNLEEWCNKGYDYIGAPIIASDAGWKNWDDPNNYKPQVGNGGFSLRKISVFKDITNPNGEFREHYKINDEILSKVIYEDKYFCNDIYNYYDIIRPSWQKALLFALDMNVDVIYANGFKEMPMGIHAWPKNIRYWKNVLEELKDNQEIIDICEERYKEYFKLYYGENEKQQNYINK